MRVGPSLRRKRAAVVFLVCCCCCIRFQDCHVAVLIGAVAFVVPSELASGSLRVRDNSSSRSSSIHKKKRIEERQLAPRRQSRSSFRIPAIGKRSSDNKNNKSVANKRKSKPSFSTIPVVASSCTLNTATTTTSAAASTTITGTILQTPQQLRDAIEELLPVSVLSKIRDSNETNNSNNSNTNNKNINHQLSRKFFCFFLNQG
jgi:hypothetical protein